MAASVRRWHLENKKVLLRWKEETETNGKRVAARSKTDLTYISHMRFWRVFDLRASVC